MMGMEGFKKPLANGMARAAIEAEYPKEPFATAAGRRMKQAGRRAVAITFPFAVARERL